MSQNATCVLEVDYRENLLAAIRFILSERLRVYRMSFQFLKHPLKEGSYEPEGIYLSSPVDGPYRLLQGWGENEQFYGTYTYNGVALKGHNGIDLLPVDGAAITCVDTGRIVEIGYESEGYERYLKIDHKWGESFYAYLGLITVEAGQMVKRGELVAHLPTTFAPTNRALHKQYLHFGMRIKPFNRFDGWGGFVDPIPFLQPATIEPFDSTVDPGESESFVPHKMLLEHNPSRRP
ncbi:MAG: M23 family metallopeptidase [Caldilineaceae bacterium]